MDPKRFSKACFVICPVGEEASDTRERSDRVLKHIIVPAVEKHGLEAIRADQIDELGIITSQIVHFIIESPIVVADLTSANPNVFYELAIRHMIKKPVIMMRRAGEHIPFDISASRVIDYDLDLDGAERARTNIARSIGTILTEQVIDYGNPISIAIESLRLKYSDDPEKFSLGEIMDMMSELRYSVNRIDRRLSHIDYSVAREYVEETIEDIKENVLADLKQSVSNMARNIKRRGLTESSIDEMHTQLTRLEAKLEFYLDQDDSDTAA